MIEPKNITIEGMKFQLRPMGGLKASRLDKKVVALLIPAFGGLKDASLDSDIDLGSLFEGISTSLSNLSDADYENLVCSLLSETLYLPESGAPVELNSNAAIDTTFSMKLMALYKLLFEIMKYNKFSPFALVGDGNLANAIHTFAAQEKKEKAPGLKLGKSEN